jgi:hypothetical protein
MAPSRRYGTRQVGQTLSVGSDSDEVTPVPSPKRPTRPQWRGRDQSDIWITLVVPLAAIWVLCLTSPGQSLGVAEGAGFALLFSLVYVPLMWMRIRR